jgi:hypothetical protein
MKKKILNLFKKLTRKTVLGALALAIALWFFSSLNETYTVRIEIPLNVQLPQNRALEDELPENITVETRGTGWNLFYLMAVNSQKMCNVDLTEKVINDTLYNINRSLLLSSVKSFEEVQSINISPENLTVKTDKIVEKKVPLESDVSIHPNKNFVLAGSLELEPDSIKLRGNIKVIKKLDKWRTENISITGVRNDISMTIGLDDTLSGIVDRIPPEVLLLGDLQMLADKTFYQLKIEIIGGNLPVNYRIYPEYFDVTVSAGVEQLYDLKREDILVSLQITDILNNSNGLLKPHINIPEGYELKTVLPDIIYVKKISKIENLEKISRK